MIARSTFADPRRMLSGLRRSCLAPPERLTVDEWADRHRVVQAPSRFPGPWRTSLVPYLRRPMRDYSDPAVRGIVLMFAPQLAKTEFLINCLGFTIDRDPYPTMLLMDSQQTAREFSQDRLLPAIRASGALARHLSPHAWDTKRTMMSFDSMTLFLTGANSVGRLASKPIGRLLCDERDKYPAVMRRGGVTEAGAADLSRKRLGQYGSLAKWVETCSPTLENYGIHAEYLRSTQCRYHVPCPLCGVFQELVLGTDSPGGLRWEGGSGRDLPQKEHAEHTARVRATAYYQCAACRGRLTDLAKPTMLERGVWVAAGQTIEGKYPVHRRDAPDRQSRDRESPDRQSPGRQSQEPGTRNPEPGTRNDGPIGPDPGYRIVGDPPAVDVRGYQASALLSPFQSWGDVAASFVALRGEINQDFVNGVLGEPWRQRAERSSEGDLVEIAREQAAAQQAGMLPAAQRFRRGTVPDEVVCLIGAMDVQRDGVFAFLAGFAEEDERYLIDWSFIPAPEVADAASATDARLVADVWALVIEHLAKWWPTAGGQEGQSPVANRQSGPARQVDFWGIDSGDRTHEVYRLARIVGPRLVPIKGQEMQLAPLVVSTVDVVPQHAQQASARARAGARAAAIATGETLELLSIRPHYWRDQAYVRLSRRAGTHRGAWRFPIDFLDEGGGDVLRQLTAEERVSENRRGRPVSVWRKRPGRTQNHWWDCAVYLEALGEFTQAARVTRAAYNPPAIVYGSGALPGAPGGAHAPHAARPAGLAGPQRAPGPRLAAVARA